MHSDPIQETTARTRRPALSRWRRLFLARPYLPAAFQWSLAIGLLIAVSMGLLGWLAISQQQSTFNSQMDAFGKSMVGQLAGNSGEPLLAEDHLALELLVRQLNTQTGVLGAAIMGRNGPRVMEGHLPTLDSPRSSTLDWEWQDTQGHYHRARSYRARIHFADVSVGEAVITLDADALTVGLQRAMSSMSLAALLLIPLAVGVGVLLANRLSRPLRTLASISNELQPGEQVPLPGRSAQAEISHVIGAFNRLSQNVLQREEQVESLFRRYVPTSPALLQADDQPLLRAREVEASVLFCDVTAFTALAEPLPPAQVVDILNDYFGYIVVAAHSCEGIVDSFSGDCAMVVFGSSELDPHHRLHAATCAILIRETIRHINLRRQSEGTRQVQFRIGVHSGPMAVCTLGTSERMQPTVIGDTVNVASRLCSLGDPGDITLGETTAEDPEVRERLCLTRLPRQPVHGRGRQVVPYRAEALDQAFEVRLQAILGSILPTAGP